MSEAATASSSAIRCDGEIVGRECAVGFDSDGFGALADYKAQRYFLHTIALSRRAGKSACRQGSPEETEALSSYTPAGIVTCIVWDIAPPLALKMCLPSTGLSSVTRAFVAPDVFHSERSPHLERIVEDGISHVGRY